MIMRFLFVLLFSLLTANVIAQRFGVNPLRTSDRSTYQLYGKVSQITEQTYKVDYTRRIVEKGDFVSSILMKFSFDGSITEEQSFDDSGELLSKTIYQYKDSLKSVSTTYDASGTRTLQTLYANTADGVVARMRYTDAIGITISTSEVSHKKNWAAIEENFNDGEFVKTEYFYNSDMRLDKIIKKSGSDVSERVFVLDANGNPRKEISKQNGKKTILEYQYKTDDYGNWIERLISSNGKVLEQTKREIVYF